MKIIQFLSRESDLSLRAVTAMSLVSALGNTIVLYAINEATETAFSDRAATWQLFLIYGVSLGLFYVGRKYALSRLIQGLEGALLQVRKRIAGKLENAELPFIEQVGKARLFNTLFSDTNLISKSAVFLGSALQSGITVVFAFAYIGLLSLNAFVLSMATVVAGTALYLGHHRYIVRQQAVMEAREQACFGAFEHLLGGFKELKLNEPKAKDLLGQVQRVADASGRVKLAVGQEAVGHVMFMRTLVDVLLGVLAFGLPLVSDIAPEVLVKVIATILFVSGSLGYFISALPSFDGTDAAVTGLETLEAELAAAKYRDDTGRPQPPLAGFEEIRCQGLCFRYTDPADRRVLFEVGPLDLTLRRGETVFVVGGNGSGKSTFMQLVTGLYRPDAGGILLDGQPVTAQGYRAYRSLFSVIFGDFHLFDRLYGLEAVDPARVDHWLRVMQLDGKTRFSDGRFTHQNLSTGQKKRLALIVTLMEDKPIFIFDEWAADQDPDFRRFFYEELLERFTAEGKTVIAVTHDDRYFHLADRVVKMECGRILEQGIEPFTGPGRRASGYRMGAG